MSKHFERALAKVNKELLAICALVEESVFRAVRSASERDALLARRVIDSDQDIDEREVELEEECLEILALYQPVAQDLRFVIAALKLNNDLERIGDLGVNIAERAVKLASMKAAKLPQVLEPMEDLAKSLLRDSINSLVNQNVALAHSVIESDRRLDELYSQFLNEIEASVKAQPEEAEAFLALLSVGRNLERIGDHCTNIAEDVLYLVDGEIVRHARRQSKLAES